MPINRENISFIIILFYPFICKTNKIGITRACSIIMKFTFMCNKNIIIRANKWVKQNYYEGDVFPIDGHDFTVSYGKSKTVLDGATASCFDVMDPGDCKLLFNTCDPVMCPPSRFN